MNDVLKDFMNREFKKGDVIVYPGRRSSSLWMNIGIVNAIDEIDEVLKIDTIKKDFSEPIRKTKTKISRIDNVIIVGNINENRKHLRYFKNEQELLNELKENGIIR